MHHKIRHPSLGSVNIVEHPASGHISARWKSDGLKVVVPPGISDKKILEALDSMESRILAKKLPPQKFHDIEYPDWQLRLSSQSLHPEKIILSFKLPVVELKIGTAVDTSSTPGNDYLNASIHAAGRRIATEILIPRARQIASKLDCQPEGWKISHGNQVLGHCNSNGIIALSYINVFLPPHLRDYIVSHELAHLKHMNHSEAFHSLCDSYLCGHEKELAKELKHFKWPIRRK